MSDYGARTCRWDGHDEGEHRWRLGWCVADTLLATQALRRWVVRGEQFSVRKARPGASPGSRTLGEAKQEAWEKGRVGLALEAFCHVQEHLRASSATVERETLSAGISPQNARPARITRAAGHRPSRLLGCQRPAGAHG